MRTELEQMALIERYLQGALGQAETQQFEAKLAIDPLLRQEVALQKMLVKAVERQGLKQELEALHAQLYPTKPLVVAEVKGERPDTHRRSVLARFLNLKSLALAAVLAVGVGLCDVPLTQQWAAPLANQSPAFEPTFAGFDVPFQALEVDAAAGKAFRLASGSQVRVPAGAFVDKDGEPVVGKVQLNYREFHQAAEIIASGIPMEYQGGVFESGGMFELRGQQGAEPVFIAEGKRIEVKLASFTDDPDFKHYYLHEPGGNRVAVVGGSGLVPTAQAQDTRQPRAEWAEIGPSNLEPNTLKQRQLDSLGKLIYAQARAKAQLAIGQEGDGDPAPAEEAQAVLDSRWEFKLKVSPATGDGDGPDLQLSIGSNGNIQAAPGQGRRSRPALTDTTMQELRQLAFMQMLAENPITWRYAGRSAVEEHPNLTRNRWVLDETWTDVRLQAPLYVPKRRLTQKSGSPLAQPKFVTFSPDSRYLLLGKEGEVELWNTQGELLHTFRGYHFATFAPHTPQLLLANASEAHLADLAGQVATRFRAKVPTRFTRLEPSANSQRILGFGTDEVIRIWTREGKLLCEMKDSRKSWFIEATFDNPEGTRVLVKAHDGEVFLFDDKGEVKNKLKEFARVVPKFGPSDLGLEAQPGKKTFVHRAKGVNRQGDSVQLATRSVLPALTIWQNDKPIDWLRLDNLRQEFVQSHFAPDGEVLLVSANDGQLYLWQRNQADSVQRLELSNNQFSFVTYVRKPAPASTLANTREPAPSLDDLMAPYLAEVEDLFADVKAKIEAEANVLRAFGVEQFGVYNIDRVYQDESAIAVRATLDLGTPELNQQLAADQSFRAYYLTGQRGNVVIRLHAGNLAKLPLSPSGQNQLLVLLPGERVARYGPAEFAKLNWADLRRSGQHHFQLLLTPQPVQSLTEWRALLGLASPGAANG
jgi:WD40 repeat protein